MVAFWARPQAYLDPAIRAATSPWHDLPAAVVEHGLARLREDLDSGEWQCRYPDLLRRGELDVGLRLITSEKGAPLRSYSDRSGSWRGSRDH